LSGASAQTSLALGNLFVTAQWQENQQNFVITQAAPGGDTLEGLFGNWVFDYVIISTFADRYALTDLVTANGMPGLAGVDYTGGLVLAERTADILDDPFPYTFAMLDPSSIICKFYIFNQSDPNTIIGQYYQLHVTGGQCDSSNIGAAYPLQGFHLDNSSPLRLKNVVASSAQEQLRVEEAAQAQIGQEATIVDPASLKILNALQNRLHELCNATGC
jgi:hypothetical protein